MEHGAAVECGVDIKAACQEVFDVIHDYAIRLRWDTLLSKASIVDGSAQAGVGVRTLCVGRHTVAAGEWDRLYQFRSASCRGCQNDARPVVYIGFRGKHSPHGPCSRCGKPGDLQISNHSATGMASRDSGSSFAIDVPAGNTQALGLVETLYRDTRPRCSKQRLVLDRARIESRHVGLELL